ncbi:phostensin [Sorex fumeus]|uniref:phostensin n=1 Tax=Sorex fumeus TaxID=62283 RepID=UPI0024AD7CF2|nr:phostensin [Sorex fumeus]XP_055983654.1 phostensin [Sorex fumeus]XP_055983655.1 phostensin [Sorex fumeus]
MATMPDWKLQLLARRRQEEAAIRGREKAERERLSQMPAWKRGLLERRRAKLGMSPGEPSPAPGTTEAGPPDPDEPAVLLEAIGPVHQNRFIRQERQQQQQRAEELAERRPAERKPSPGETRDQSPKGREPREERPTPRGGRESGLGPGGARESSPKPSDWRQSPGEARDQSSRLTEAYRRLSPGDPPERILRAAEPQEQSPLRKEGLENRLSPPGLDDQKLGLPEAHKRRPDSGETQEQSLVQLEAPERRRRLGEAGRDCLEECGSRAELQSARVPPDEVPTTTREGPEHPSRRVEAAEPRPGPVEDGDKGSRLTEGWKWTLNSGKVREWTPRDMDSLIQKPEAPEKHVGPPREEAEEVGAGVQSRPLSTPQSRSPAPAPLPSEAAGPGGPKQQEEEAGELRPPPAAPLSPAPPSAPQPPGDALMSRLFYGVKPGPGVGAPRRSGHTFTVNPRRSVPATAPASPASPASADAAAPGAGKKRYPTAEEILVLGGYLRLSRSCLAKGPPERHHKQLKISFSETALETTYQYPSESSVLEELGPEPEAPNSPSPPAAQPDDEEDEEELLLQRELQGGLRTKALFVDESCRR